MGPSLDLKFLQLVIAIADEGSMSRAGRRLGLSQSALSHQLATLEARLGIEVFKRDGRTLRLTPLGERLLSRARLIVAQVESLESEISMRRPPRQELRLTTQCFTCYHWLPTLLDRFERCHSGVAVSLVVESTRHALAALDADAVDLAITTEPREDSRYERQLVFEDELMIALSPRHLLATRACIDFSDLGAERLLIHPPSEADRAWFRRVVACEIAISRPREVQAIPVTDSIVELVAQGHGCALLTRLSAAGAAEQGRIALRSFSPRPLVRDFFAVWRRENPKRLPVSDLVLAVSTYCEGQCQALNHRARL
jgi:LysR family transcriptional regulator, regulator for metE and metH